LFRQLRRDLRPYLVHELHEHVPLVLFDERLADCDVQQVGAAGVGTVGVVDEGEGAGRR